MLQNGKKRIVVKVGTSTLTHKNGKTNIARMAKLSSVLSDLMNEGHQIVLVSSGAIGVGVGKLKLAKRPTSTKELQACAAVGQCELMFLYDKFFSEYGHCIAQLLVTDNGIKQEKTKHHIIDTFNQLLDYGTLPIVNENDSVSVEELVNGDNDCLSANIATIIDADMLIMLTDTDGLYDSNPNEKADAKLISRVDVIDEKIETLASGSSSDKGTGGFVTKINAAKISTNSGIETIIINGEKPTSIYKVLEGKEVGTYFKPKGE